MIEIVDTIIVSRHRHTIGASQSMNRRPRPDAYIEPVIGHLKTDGLLERNHPHGERGDAINLVLAAAGHNLRLLLAWLRRLCALFLVALLGPTARPAAA